MTQNAAIEQARKGLQAPRPPRDAANWILTVATIVAMVLGGGAAYGLMKQKVDDHEARITRLEQQEQMLEAVKVWMDKHP